MNEGCESSFICGPWPRRLHPSANALKQTNIQEIKVENYKINNDVLEAWRSKIPNIFQ